MIDVEFEPAEDQVVIYSEISPAEGIELDLSITAGIFASEGVQRPDDAQIFLSGTDLAAEATAFIYSRNTNRYVLRNRDFRPSPGEQYSISINFPDDTFQPINATTEIPMPVNISRAMVVDKNEITSSGGLVDIIFDVELELGNSLNEETFLHIIPERIFSQYKIDANGELRITFFAETEPLQVLNILDGHNAVGELIHQEGVYVDYSKLNGKNVKLRLSTTTLLDPSIDILESMEVTIRTLTKDLFEYHESLHKQLINNATPFTSPTATYTNVENAIGIFGGYSVSNSLIKL